MATTPQFANTPNLGANLSAARISTANTNRDGTGTLATLVTGGANGTRVDRVNMRAISTTTAGMLRFYLADAASNIRLIHEIAISAVTPSATVRAWGYDSDWVRSDGQPVVVVPSGWTLRVSTQNGAPETFDVVAIVSGDF